MDELPVTVTILDRKYKMKVGSADEQYLREAAELTDRQAKNYGKMYAHQDGQDLLAMVSLTQISRLLKLQAGRQFEDTQLESRLAAIDKLLDSRSDKEISCTGTRNSL